MYSPRHRRRRRRRRPSVMRPRAHAQFSQFLPDRYPIITTKRELAVGIIIEMSRDHVIKLSRNTSIRTTNTVTRNSRYARRRIRRDNKLYGRPHTDFRHLCQLTYSWTPVKSIFHVSLCIYVVMLSA